MSKSRETKEPKDSREMRGFLIKQMVKVANGEMGRDDAHTIASLSQQVYNHKKIEIMEARLLVRDDKAEIKPVTYK